MAQQRDVAPLPPGRYWVLLTSKPTRGPDGVFQTGIQVFDAWQRANHLIVHVETSSLQQDGAAVSEFVIFNVIAPAFLWDASQLGFPNLAPASIRSVQDVVAQPDEPLEPLDQLGKFLHDVAGLGAGLGLVLVLLLAHEFSKKSPRRAEA